MNKGKGKAREEEVEDFVSEEAYSNWKKHYANKGFVAERRFRNPIPLFKEMIEQRGWEALCAHQKSGYAAVVREFYSNLVGRKDNTVFVRGVWVLSRPVSRSDPIGGSEPSSGCETQDWDSLPDFFFFKSKLAPVVIAHTYNNSKYYIQVKELPPEWCPSKSIHI